MKYLTKWGGGAYNSYPQLGQTSISKRAKNKSRNLQIFASKGIKTEYKISRTTQILLWLLTICIFAAFSLCPLAGLAAHYNLTAGGPSDSTFYINAPVFIAGDSARSKTTGSADTSTGVVNTNIKPLFKTDGTVNAEVLVDLLNMVNSESVCKGTTENSNAPTYLSAKNFGQYGTQNNWSAAQKGNAQILVKLFEDTTTTANSVDAASAQYWQAVYRSINGENDVLTLYMCRPYIDAQFNPSSDTTYNNKTYRYESNYSQSYLRDKTVLPLYETLKSTYSALDQYVVAPSQLASGALNLGGWQSSAYQTSYNVNRVIYGTNNGIGSSGYEDGTTRFMLSNGMDGLSEKDSSWSGTVESVYDDKLWVPSGFETLHTGYGQTATSTMQDTGRLYDEKNDVVYLNDNSSKGETYSSAKAIVSSTSTQHTTNRTGLWELNGYDRATTGSWMWLRSSRLEDGTRARGINLNGNSDNFNVDSNIGGVRVALHLNLGELKTLIPSTLLSINANNTATKSLFIFKIMDENIQIAEYSLSSGSITTTKTLQQGKTYTILVTRPIGSRLEVLCNGRELSPISSACYEIMTNENDSMFLSLALSGDMSWKNCIVV